MIYWATEPDPILHKIVSQALVDFEAMGKTWIDAPAAWARGDPHLAKVFPLPECLKAIAALLDAHASSRVLEPTGYYWLLLYTALEDYCELYNELPDEVARIVHKGTTIREIDFSGILAVFFHDLDFTIPPEALASSFVKEHLGVKDTAVYASAGLQPHPSELAFEDVAEPRWTTRGAGEEDMVWRPGSTTYPDPLDD
jgi:hypothetical protein